MDKVKRVIFSGISTSRIAKEAGIKNNRTIARYASGESNTENMQMETSAKIEKFYDENKDEVDALFEVNQIRNENGLNKIDFTRALAGTMACIDFVFYVVGRPQKTYLSHKYRHNINNRSFFFAQVVRDYMRYLDLNGRRLGAFHKAVHDRNIAWGANLQSEDLMKIEPIEPEYHIYYAQETKFLTESFEKYYKNETSDQPT